MAGFTRYLYLKEEVEVAMLMSLLNGDKERVLFWAYELYHSGPKTELIMTLWRIYYEFYAMLNPALETYLKKKQAELIDNTEHLVGIFIHNFLIRKYTLDVFMLREVSMYIETDEADAKLSMEERLASNNYEAVAHCICDTCTSIEDCAPIVATAFTYFQSQGIKNPKLLKELYAENIHPAIILISRIMHYYADLNKSKEKNGIQMGKKVYLLVEAEEALAYKTIEASPELSSDKILQKVVIYSPSDHGYNYITLFKHEYTRSSTTLNDYQNDWLYCAGKKTPIWQERIAEYGGHVNDDMRQVCWDDEESEEAFYCAYGYDTEEQPIDVRIRNIPPMDPSKNITWSALYKKYTESRPRLYVPHPDILDALE
jgi:hypothetical protein